MVMESIFIKTGIFILEILAILYLMATESFMVVFTLGNLKMGLDMVLVN